MKIINAMFARGLGGIEQAFLDYTEALVLSGNQVLCVVHPKAKINYELKKLAEGYKGKIEVKKIPNLGWWDVSAKLCLECLARKNGANLIISHGNRPTSLLRYASKKNKIPLVAVAHNYKVKPLLKADYIFSITDDLKQNIAQKGFDKSRITIIPNMIRVPDTLQLHQFKKYSNPPKIGVIARFVKKKGVDIFIEACSALKASGLQFEAIIAGMGDEAENLQSLRDERNLCKQVRFVGWVEDKQEFYQNIDIFCLPSHHEPFGIVILEAMLHSKPIVSTKSEGPLEILEHEKDSILVEKGHAGQMALALKSLMESSELGEKISAAAHKKLIKKYAIEQVSKEINSAITEITNRSK